MQSITHALLIDLVERRLAPHEEAALRAVIANDPALRDELAAIEATRGPGPDTRGVDGPEQAVGRAHRRRTTISPIRRLIALLTSDSWRTTGLATGLRGVEAWPRALLLSAGTHELDLQIGPNGGRWQIHGQVLGPEAPGTAVLSNGEMRVATNLSTMGEFVLPPVAAGRYTLTITQGDLEIVVPNLELGPSPSHT